jgi:hypothetical protein
MSAAASYYGEKADSPWEALFFTFAQFFASYRNAGE